jgi:hypothetical protein
LSTTGLSLAIAVAALTAAVGATVTSAQAQGCNLQAVPWTIFGGADRAITWCMGTSDAEFRGRSPQAAGHKANLERLCGAQLRRTIRL